VLKSSRCSYPLHISQLVSTLTDLFQNINGRLLDILIQLLRSLSKNEEATRTTCFPVRTEMGDNMQSTVHKTAAFQSPSTLTDLFEIEIRDQQRLSEAKQ
jgi:hypothetical protein